MWKWWAEGGRIMGRKGQGKGGERSTAGAGGTGQEGQRVEVADPQGRSPGVCVGGAKGAGRQGASREVSQPLIDLSTSIFLELIHGDSV